MKPKMNKPKPKSPKPYNRAIKKKIATEEKFRHKKALNKIEESQKRGLSQKNKMKLEREKTIRQAFTGAYGTVVALKSTGDAVEGSKGVPNIIYQDGSNQNNPNDNGSSI